MMRALMIALMALSGMAASMVVGPAIYEQHDFGDYGLDQFTYSLSADCTASTVSMVIMDGGNKPVQGANTYLKYVDFASPLLSSVVTDKDGNALHRLPGNVQLMRGLFILVIEKGGYRNKEVHFDLYPCFHNGTLPPILLPKPQNLTNQTRQPPTVAIENPPPPPAPPQNASGEQGQNQTDGKADGGAQTPLCAAGALLGIILMGAVRKGV